MDLSAKEHQANGIWNLTTTDISVGQINVPACNLTTTLCVFWFCLHRDYQNENQTEINYYSKYNFKS